MLKAQQQKPRKATSATWPSHRKGPGAENKTLREGGMLCYRQSLCLQFSPGWQWPGDVCLPAVGWPLWKSLISGPMLSGQVSISWSQLALLAPLLLKWAQWQGAKVAGPLLLLAGRCEPGGQVPWGERVWHCHGNWSKKACFSFKVSLTSFLPGGHCEGEVTLWQFWLLCECVPHLFWMYYF